MGFLGKGLLEGMAVTARNFVGSYFDKERLVTVQYPEERVQVPENSRTFPFLVYDDDKDRVGTMRCVACKICEVECPPKCIYIVMDRDEKGKPQQRPKVFDLDISVCMQCQICVEVCPFDAIKMDNDYEKAQYGRFTELVERLPDLLKSNGYYHKIKPTEATAVDARLKEAAEKKAKKAAPAAKPAPAAGTAAATKTPATAKTAPAATAKAKIEIPPDAPFTPEQREWLGKFLSTVSVGAAPAPASSKAPAAAALATDVAATAVPTADAPWHDPALGIQQRLDLAKSKPLADKLMAAMAQTDCHACGYDCRGYADAIASGAEEDLSLCLPGEAETQQMLEKLTKEAGKA
ncbi:MAG TPA: 4Fe-4S dicluster domain-containing protein [Verrucomicrobiae bacterium]|nr:4Fe-4S dicluster domain-containing protein [Verrucomicrobiae bacterium]